MVRFLHTADWQIGMRAAHVGGAGERVRQERLAAARRVVQAAQQHGAFFLIVAGDTFEDNAIDRVLVQRVADILAEFRSPVFIIAGNHDPLVPGSVWDHAAWKGHHNLYVVSQPAPLELENVTSGLIGGVTLWPCPLKEKHSTADPTQWINARHSQNICVGIAHGTVEGIAQDELDYPIARHAATRAGLDYLALGHWHSSATYADADGAARMAYCGTHEPTKFGERDSGNVLLVEIAQRGSAPVITPIRTGGLTWHSWQRQITGAEEVAQLRGEIERLAAPESALLDLTIRGLLSPQGQAELSRIEELVSARFLYGRVDTSGLLPAPADDRWVDQLPVGLLRDVALRLQQLADPSFPVAQRPEYATPHVAARALLDLYRWTSEAQP